MKRVLVVDDHDLMRIGVCSVLATEPSLSLCGQASDGLEAIEMAGALEPDIVLMDISMPRLNGLEAAKQIKQILPNTQVIILSQDESPEMMREAFDAGASRYVVKTAMSSDLLAAISAAVREDRANLRPAVDAVLGERPEVVVHGVIPEAGAAKARANSGGMDDPEEGLCTVDAQGRFTYVNAGAQKILGWTAAELLGKKMHETIHYKYPDGRPYLTTACPVTAVLETGIEIEQRDVFIAKDGTLIPMLFRASPLKTGRKTTGMLVCFRDERRQSTRETLQKSEQIYRAIGDAVDFGIWICDAEGRNVYASPSFLKLIGVSQQQCSDKGWIDALHPDDVESTKGAWQECVRTGAVFEREHRFRRADGGWRHVLARGGPIRDERGNIAYWAGINLDIQHRKESELALSHSAEQTQLVERELRELVQNLEAGVSERTRELENASSQLRELSAKLLQTQDEERRRIARELHDGVGQLLAALNMNLAKLDDEKKNMSAGGQQFLDENAVLMAQALQEIRTMSYLLHPPLLDEVGLESALRWYVEGFAERTKIAVEIDAEPDFSAGLPRELALSLFRVVQESLTNIHRHSGSARAFVKIVRSKGEITLVLKDEGKGIAPELQSRIASGESGGVGLRGMRERIRQFDGSLEVRADDGGTQITATLPIPGENTPPHAGNDKANHSASSVLPPVAAESRARPATLLCIDDESAGLLPRKMLLESAGYRVIEARSGEEGIQMFRSEQVDAVLLDYWMAGMKGTVVASELKRIDPTVPIIVLSGMADLPGEAAGLVDQWLVKGSHRAEGLLDSVATLLRRRAK